MKNFDMEGFLRTSRHLEETYQKAVDTVRNMRRAVWLRHMAGIPMDAKIKVTSDTHYTYVYDDQAELKLKIFTRDIPK